MGVLKRRRATKHEKAGGLNASATKMLCYNVYYDMTKEAFYGYLEFFEKEEYKARFDENDEEDYDLYLSMLNGAYRNVEFLKKCYNLPIVGEGYTELLQLLIANNLNVYEIDGLSFGKLDYVWHDFKYANYETCKTVLELSEDHGKQQQEHNNATVAFVCVLMDWKDLYDKCNLSKLDRRVYSLALYQKKDYYIKKQLELENTQESVDDSWFLSNCLHTNIQYEENLYWIYFEQYDQDTHLDELENIIPGEKVNERYFTKYNIVNNFDLAYKMFERGDRSNLVLSKLILSFPHRFKDLYSEFQPFLIFCRSGYALYHHIEELWTKINPLVKYNLMYIYMILSSIYSRTDFKPEYIDLPEYSLYVLSKKLRQREMEERILQLFKEHKKLYKILDMENERYLDPPQEVYELPEVEDLDLITGDILNPYVDEA